jgi:RecA/RadA recombinase
MHSLYKEFQEFFNLLFPNKGIISIWGDYGVGKTTFSLQKAIDTASNEKNIVYIYTKPNFPFEKINNLIQESIKKILYNITFLKSLNFEDLYSLVFDLEFFVLDVINKAKSKIELIIIDSITDLYRLELNKESKEKNFLLNYKLSQMLANLFFLNETYNINILIVNNKTNITSNGHLIEVQSGGLVMDYWINSTIKIIRTHQLNQRKFILKKKDESKIIESSAILTKTGFL